MTQRARTDEDKRSRRAEILDAARSVFDDVEVDDFTMDSVATCLGLAKGTLYRYVPTRDALLLALAADEFADWFDHVDAAITRLDPAPWSLDVAAAFTAIVVDSLIERPRFMRLTSLVASVFERNIPLDTARAYKMFVVERSAVTIAALAGRSGCTAERALQFLVHLQALATGLYHQAHPAPVVIAVLVDPALAHLSIDLRAELTHGVHALVVAALADTSSTTIR